jgi:hypothetical protein
MKTAWNHSLILTMALCVLGLSACTEQLQFEKRAEVDGDSDGDNIGADGQDPDDVDPIDQDDDGGGNPGASPCPSTTTKTENLSLTANAIEGANIVFLIDDSGSMSGEFQKVVWELQEFINGILGVTANNYRMVMIYDTDGAAIRNRSFYRDRNLTDRINNANPFIDQMASDDVAYFKKETWSKWADMAFARVFMPSNFLQTLPLAIPTDSPNDSPVRVTSTPMQAADCAGMGKYFRPRDSTSDYSYGSFACIEDEDGANIANSLLAGFNVNIVAISDDDLNVAFDRAA